MTNLAMDHAVQFFNDAATITDTRPLEEPEAEKQYAINGGYQAVVLDLSDAEHVAEFENGKLKTWLEIPF